MKVSVTDVHPPSTPALPGRCLCVCTQLYFALERTGPQVSGSKMRQVETHSGTPIFSSDSI